MFESLKTLWKKEQTPLQDYDQQSRQLAEEIARLEGELQRQPGNSEVQKTLMLTYNRALSISRCRRGDPAAGYCRTLPAALPVHRYHIAGSLGAASAVPVLSG